MRNVNPDQLDQLARLLDGRGGAQDNIDEAFTRASSLGVSSKVAALRPMRTWASENAPDLRRRAVIGRLEDGDPEAGAKWAGFDAKDVAKAGLIYAAPDVLLLVNAMASSDGPESAVFRRQSNESLADWVDRLRAHAFASIPALAPYEKQIEQFLGIYGDVTGVLGTGGVATFHAGNVTRVLVGNSVAQGGWANSLKLWASRQLRILGSRPWAPNKFGAWGRNLRDWSPPIRSLAAPGSWLPGSLSALAAGNPLYQNATQVPGVGGYVAGHIGTGFNWLRNSGVMNSPILGTTLTANRTINFLVGSDRLAAMYGGLTHSGQVVARSGNASLIKVTRNMAADMKLFGNGRLSSLGSGLRVAGRTAGFLRGAGIAGSAFSTVYSAANVIAQGDPRKHFGSRESGAKYVADIAEGGFNASMTAAMVAPNPWTLGAVGVTGIIYGGAKVVEHWDDIKKGGGKAKDWVKDKGKSAVKKLNPLKW
ncbi:PE-PGRS family protein [Streptomyces sp. NPDC060048]|uniref:PE-PGRS family protein n=1 Tax=unclassified Streptomyces TaxID=2593676 RepID=UPI0036A2D8F1